MASFESEDVRLDYTDSGSGDPVVMLHGFGMSQQACWLDHGWPEALNAGGFRSITLDSRGHGRSAKPLEAQRYESARMTGDVLALLDHLGLERAHVVGHSMGARTAFDLALTAPDRVISLTTISVGSNLFEQVRPEMLIKALRDGDRSDVPAGLVAFADMLLGLGNDRAALTACLYSPRPIPERAALAALQPPTLLVCGTNDAIAGDPKVLEAALPGATLVLIGGCEHTDVLASRNTRRAVLEFLRGR